MCEQSHQFKVYKPDENKENFETFQCNVIPSHCPQNMFYYTTSTFPVQTKYPCSKFSEKKITDKTHDAYISKIVGTCRRTK